VAEGLKFTCSLEYLKNCIVGVQTSICAYRIRIKHRWCILLVQPGVHTNTAGRSSCRPSSWVFDASLSLLDDISSRYVTANHDPFFFPLSTMFETAKRTGGRGQASSDDCSGGSKLEDRRPVGTSTRMHFKHVVPARHWPSICTQHQWPLTKC
jgi:hypothetical protein